MAVAKNLEPRSDAVERRREHVAKSRRGHPDDDDMATDRLRIDFAEQDVAPAISSENRRWAVVADRQVVAEVRLDRSACSSTLPGAKLG